MPETGSHAAHARNLRMLFALLFGAVFVLTPLFAVVVALGGSTSDGEALPSSTRWAMGGGGALVAALSLVVIARYVRSATTFDADGLTMRGTLGTTVLPWSEVRALFVDTTRGRTSNAAFASTIEYRNIRLARPDGSHRKLPGVTVTKKWESTLDEVFAAARPFAEQHGVTLRPPSA